MKAYHAVIDYPVDNSFIVKYDNFSHFNYPLHFHNEYEIVYIIKSSGKKYVGDVVENFAPGDLSFYSNNLPHSYLNDKQYHNKNPEYYVNAIVVLWPPDFFSSWQMIQPEFSHIQKIISKSHRGLKFPEKVVPKAAGMLHKMLKTSGLNRYIIFLKFLDYLGSSESHPIASLGFSSTTEDSGDNRMQKVDKFCRHNFNRRFTLKEVSSIAAMSTSSFCRYFHKNTGKTFVRFINELRISYSCEMLKKDNQIISFISTKSGFNNISNFNRVFKEIAGKSPSEYRKSFMED